MHFDVVLVTHNSASHLSDALTALPDDANVIVVDNASSDDSAAIAAAHGATVVRNAGNAGFAAACNRGAALGSAKQILFLNPDAVIGADALERLLAELDDPSVGVVSPRLLYPDGSKQRFKWPYPSPDIAWREAFGLHRLTQRASTPDVPVADGFVVGAVFAVRRDAFEAANGFDERFWLYGEEADLCRRIAELGWRVDYVANSVAIHIGGASGGDDPATQALVGEHFDRGGEHFVAKHQGPSALVSYRSANLTGSVVRGGLGVGAHAPGHRWRVRRLLRTLATAPRRVALDSPATRTPGKGLVVCSLEAWDDVWRRNQFFLRELLAADPELRVLFVEPAFDVAHERRSRSERRHAKGLRPVDADGRVVRFEPVKWLPRKVGPWADRWRDDQVRDAVQQLGFVEPRLWVNDPSYATLADQVEWPAVYDITDDWTEAADPVEAVKVRANEAKLFARCEAVTVCSPGLADSRANLREELVVIPNAVDTEHFQSPRPRPDDLPVGPCVVYVGTLHTDRLDVDLVAEMAEQLPESSVVLVGPDVLDHPSRARLDRAGVLRFGPRPYQQIPGYLQHADVIVAPHLVSGLTENLDPIKAYECLAVGTPTVATPVAGFRGGGDPIRTVERGGFVDAVSEVLADPPDVAPQTVPSWTDRATDFAEVLDTIVTAPPDTADKLRVVFFDHCAKLSGGELALARMLVALERVDPLVILGENGPLEDVLADNDIQVEILELDGRLNGLSKDATGVRSLPLASAFLTLEAVWRLTRRLRATQPDLLHTNSLKAGVIGSLAGRLAGVPVVWHVHDRIAPDYLPRSTVKMMRALINALPNAVIANSETTRETLPNIDDVHVIANALPAGWGPSANVRPMHDGPIRVAMTGRLSPWKGQHIFIEAFARAFPDGGAKAVIAGEALFGEDDYANSLHTLITDLGLTDSVDLIGHVDDVHGLIEATDIVVHASTLPEPFGQTVVEAMALGRAVVASDAGGPTEIITDGIDGVLVTPDDPAALAKALADLAGDPAMRVRLGDAGQLRARQYRPAVIADEMEQAFTTASAGRTRR